MKKYFVYALLVSLFTISCSNDENLSNNNSEDFRVENIPIENIEGEQSTKNRSSGVQCQEFTIGISWPITIETTVSYCCVGDWCIPGPGQPCPNCGFVGSGGGDNKIVDYIQEKKIFKCTYK